MKKLLLLILTILLIGCSTGGAISMDQAKETLTNKGFSLEDITTDVNQEGVKEALLAMKGSTIILQYYDTTDPTQARFIYDALKGSVDQDVDREEAEILEADNTLRVIRNDELYVHLEEKENKVLFAFSTLDTEEELVSIIKDFGF